MELIPMRPPFTHPAVLKPMTSKTSKGSGKNDVVSLLP